MARLDDLMAFARAHGLKIGTIRDLIAYRLQEGSSGRARRRERRSPPQRRATGRRRSSATRRAARSSSRWSTARSTRRRRPWCGCTASTCSPTCSARPAPRRPARRGDADDRARKAPAWSSRSTPPRRARCRARSTSRSGKPAEAGDAVRDYGIGAQILAALGIHDMILLTNTHHSPVGARRLRPRDRRRAADRRRRSLDGHDPDRRGALLSAPQRHAARRRARGDRGGGPQA